MKKVIIIRWCEIHLKGKNRHYFEKLLEDNIKEKLKGYTYKFVKIQGRYLIENLDFELVDEVISRLEGIKCGFKGTSCPDQLAQALKEAKK